MYTALNFHQVHSKQKDCKGKYIKSLGQANERA